MLENFKGADNSITRKLTRWKRTGFGDFNPTLRAPYLYSPLLYRRPAPKDKPQHKPHSVGFVVGETD